MKISDENQGNKLKNLQEKIKMKNISDEIEMKDYKIKEINKKLKNIKSSSLKDFVYANRQIPLSWKNKMNYQDQVLGILLKDRNLLSYVGNSDADSNNKITSKINLKKSRGKLKLNTRNRPASSKLKFSSCIEENNKENNLPSSRNYSSITTKKNLKLQRNKTLGEKQLNNILSELQINFPIKEKLKELFPENLIKTINIKTKTIENKICNNNVKYPAIKPEKRKNNFRQNIFVNLVSSKDKHKSKRVQSAFMKNTYKKDDDFFLKKINNNFKDEAIINQLESINFFGPYYSYCPPCGNRNIDFYKNLDKNKLIQIVQQIKKIRTKGILWNITERAKDKNVAKI